MAESIWSDGAQLQKPNSKPTPGRGPDRLPLVAPEHRQKNAPGGTRSFSSSADEFRPAIPRSGWSPPEPVSASPACTDYQALPTWHLKTGTFSFAGKRNFLLCLDRSGEHFKLASNYGITGLEDRACAARNRDPMGK